MSNYIRSAAKIIVRIFILGILAGIVAYITRIILARNLTPEEYGLFYAVFSFFNFLMFFREMGIGTSLVRYIAEYNIEKKFDEIKTAIVSVLVFQLLSSLLIVIALILLAGFLTERYFNHPKAYNILILLLLYFLGTVFYTVIKTVFNGLQNIKIYTSLDLIKNSTALLLILIFFKVGLKVYSPVLAYALLCFIVPLILLPSLLKNFSFFKYKITAFWPITKKLFLFGLPVFASSIGGKIIGDIDTLMLTWLRNLTEVGIYNITLPTSMLLLSFSMSVSSVAFPTIVKFWIKKDWRRLTLLLKNIYQYSFLLILPPSLTIIIFSKELINSFFGSEYVAGTLSLQILIVGAAFYFVAGIISTILMAFGKPKTIAKITAIAAITNIILNLILIPHYGINGAAFATTISYLIILTLSIREVTKDVPLRLPKIIWLKTVLVSVGFLVLIYYLKELLVINFWMEIIISGAISTLFFVLINYLLGVIDMKEIKKYIRIITKKKLLSN